MKLPMLYLIGYFVTFVMGGLTGVMVAVVPFDRKAHDTAFVTAHLHYVLVGGFVFPMLAGAYYWLPHFTGNQRSFRLGELVFWLIFIGFHATFFLLHLAGLLGQPRRVESYPGAAGWTWINLISSVGGFIMAFGFALFAIDIAQQIFLSRRSRRNPWQAGTLEWQMMIPPASYNIASLPHVGSREPANDHTDLANALARGEGYLGGVRHDWRETLSVDLNGRIRHIVVLPGNTRLPVVTAVVTGGFFVSLLLKLYWLAPLALAGVAALGWRWAWALGRRQDPGALPIGRGAHAPTHAEVDDPPGWHGSVFLLLADATLFGSLLFGQVFLLTVAPGGLPPFSLDGSWLIIGMAAVAAFAAVFLPRQAGAAAEQAIAGQSLLVTTLGFSQWLAPAPTSHAAAALIGMLNGYALFHAGVALIMLFFVRARRRAGFLSSLRRAEPRIALLWSDYAAASGAIAALASQLPALLR